MRFLPGTGVGWQGAAGAAAGLRVDQIADDLGLADPARFGQAFELAVLALFEINLLADFCSHANGPRQRYTSYYTSHITSTDPGTPWPWHRLGTAARPRERPQCGHSGGR